MNEWQTIKETAKELKDAASVIFGALLFALAMLVGIWGFIEAFFQVTLSPTQAVFITAVLGLVYIGKVWWLNKNSKR